jgi:PleD family two-component response regulator
MVDGLPGISPMILIGDADKALYRSKGSGRNRSTLYVQGLLERAFILRNSR